MVRVLLPALLLSLVGCYAEPDPSALDQDNDGFTPDSGDCDDFDAQVNPEAPEICNGRDDNCDQQVDEEVRMSDASTRHHAGDL